MPIGLGTAALIGGGVAAAGTIAGSAIGSSAQKKAANKAASISDKNNAANISFMRDMYGQNAGRLDPYSQNGMMAGNALMDLLLGSHGGTASPIPATGTTSAATSALGPLDGADQMPGSRAMALARDSHALGPARAALALFGRNAQQQVQTAAPPTASAPVTTTPPATNALDAFDRFRQGTNYQWRLGEGMDALNASYAGRGLTESGAADRARIEYGQNFASHELGRYMDLLAGQQGMGLTAASALAGVGQNYASGVVASNNANAQNAAGAALARGNATSNMWGGIASGIGQAGGAIYQSGFGQPSGYDYGALQSSGLYPDGVWF